MDSNERSLLLKRGQQFCLLPSARNPHVSGQKKNKIGTQIRFNAANRKLVSPELRTEQHARENLPIFGDRCEPPVPNPVTTRATNIKDELGMAACSAPPTSAKQAPIPSPLIRPILSANQPPMKAPKMHPRSYCQASE